MKAGRGGVRLEPDIILKRQFSRRLFGVDSREVREFLARTAAELDRTKVALARAHAERDTLQNRLREVAAEVDRLRGQVAVAHERIAALQTQEGLAAQVADEREALVAEREVLRNTLGQITLEVEGLRGQVAAAEEMIAGYQAREELAARLIEERDALAAVRDSLQTRLKEATTEIHRLREQATAARDKIAAYQTRRALAAQMSTERDALRRKLKDVTAELSTLRDQVAAAQTRIAAYQAEDREIAQTLLSAQKAADDIVRVAETHAQETVSAATAEAEQMIRTARRMGAETLRKAQTRAEGAVRAAEQTAAAQLARLQVEAEWVVEDARRTAAQVEQAAAQYVTGLVDQLETFISDGQFLLTLGTLGENLAGSLETLRRLQREASDEILPALHRLVQTIKERAHARETSSSPPPVPPGDQAWEAHKIISTLHRLVEAVGETAVRSSAPPSPPAAAGRETFAPAAPSASEAAAARPEGPEQDRVVRLGVRGEIVVSPVRTHYRATKITEAIARMKGIRLARLRAFQEDAASIEVITDAGTLLGIDFTLIDGVPMDVVDATDARLVLRVARTLSQSVPG